MRGWGALLLAVLVVLLLRSTALATLAARGVAFDVLAFAVAVWAMRQGETRGTLFGFLLGLAADLDAAHWMGRHALVLALLGYVIGRLSHTLVRDRARTQWVVLFSVTLVHQIWTLAFEAGRAGGVGYLVQRPMVAAIATALAGTLVLGLMRRAGGRPLFGHADYRPGA
jgi:rod shape-determining protein MreD